jgi:RimJ/RimL family protein N-acetyltransferase
MISGNLVRLRAYNKNDLKFELEYINDFEVKKNINPEIPFPLRFEDEEKWYNSINPMGNGIYTFVIEELESHKYVGICEVNDIDWKNSVATIGIFIGKPFWGKGFGTEAMRLLINFIFEEMNINKIKLSVFGFNNRAIKMYENLGFKKEATLREQIFREGKYHDEIIMGLLKREWGNIDD